MKPDLADELSLVIQRAENAEAALAYAVSTGDECAIEVEALRRAYDLSHKDCLNLTEKVIPALRKDAERYRWLRDEQPDEYCCKWADRLHDLPNSIFDAEIDAAMEQSHDR